MDRYDGKIFRMTSLREKMPKLLVLNQMAGPMTLELVEDLAESFGIVALLTGHPDTLAKGNTNKVQLYPAVPYNRNSYTQRIKSWFFYMLKAFFWLYRYPSDIPIILFSNPPFLLWLGYLMRELRGQPYGVIVHDIYPDVILNLGRGSKNNPIFRLWRVLNRQGYQKAEFVMTLGENMAANITKQFDLAEAKFEKVEVVFPWVDTKYIYPIRKENNWFAKKYDQLNKLTVMYSGNMGLGHDLESFMQAAIHLQDIENINFMFIGAGPKWKWIDETIKQYNLRNVTVLPWQDPETLPYSLGTADISLVSVEKEVEGLMIPSKAIYALASGSPLIASVNKDSEIAIWIDRYECGVHLLPGDIDGLVDAITILWRNQNLLEKYKENALIATKNDFNRQINVNAIIKIISSSTLFKY